MHNAIENVVDSSVGEHSFEENGGVNDMYIYIFIAIT